MTRYFRRNNDNPNTFIGLILLIVLGVFVGPNLLPEFLSDLSPYIYAGVPCSRLPSALGLTAHQSIIGRQVEDPITLDLEPSPISQDNILVIRLTITNTSLGTIPIVYNPDDVPTLDDNSNGFGIVLNPAPANGGVGRLQTGLTGYPESEIRLLGPRQKCVHSFQIQASGGMISNGGTAQAYYRMTIAGENQTQRPGTRNIFPDQGLNILLTGVVRSPVITIPPRSTAPQ